MSEVLPTPNPAHAARKMPRRQWILLAVLVGLHALMTLALILLSWVQVWEYQYEYDGYYFFVQLGFFYGQSTLLGLWSALAMPVWTRRLPPVLLLLGLSTLAAIACINLPFDWLGNAFVACMATLAPFVAMQSLLFARRFARWRLMTKDSLRAATQPQPAQFSLGRMLVWMTGIAVLLALARLLVPAQFGEFIEWFIVGYFLTWLVFTVAYTTLLASIVCTPYSKLGHIVWAFGCGVLVVGLFALEVFLFTHFVGEFDEVLRVMLPLRGTHLLVSLVSLLLIRGAGYQLLRLPRAYFTQTCHGWGGLG